MLPLKSVMKLKCVCKAWWLLIDEFIGLYLKRIKESYLDIIVFDQTRVSDDLVEGYVYSLSTGGVLATLMTLPFRITEGEGAHIFLMQSVNGLICVTNLDEFKVCNPLTGQVVTLPECPRPLYSNIKGLDRLGFGYSPLKDEYKVVKIFQSSCINNPLPHEKIKFDYALCTLGSDLSWRKIKGPNYFSQFSFVYCNGSIYWIAGLLPDCWILEFDLENETFTSTSLPFVLDGRIRPKSLAVMENCLCIVTFMPVEHSRDIVIWRMDDDGKWVMKYVIPVAEYGQCWRPGNDQFWVNCLDKHKILVELVSIGGWILYDIKSKASQPIHHDTKNCIKTACFYWGNMLPIGAQQSRKTK
ncbi:hypothetical protein PTKIN_Ptkin15bG0172500 [Pterospermum kingtungense]